LKCDAGQGYLFAKPLDVDTAGEVLRTGLTPLPERQRAATTSRRRTGSAQFWVRGGRVVAAHPVLCVAALVGLLSAGLVVMFGSVRPGLGESPMPVTDVNQQPAAKTTAAQAAPIPMLTTEPVVERPKGPSPAPVTTEQAVSPGRSSAPPSGRPTPSKPALSATSLAAAPVLTMQTMSLEVVHLHRFGNCRGRLDVTRTGVAFVSEDEDSKDAFTLKHTDFLHTLADDTLTVRSATRTYRFKAGPSRGDNTVQLSDLADRIQRSRR
jgi:hypothetical protein